MDKAIKLCVAKIARPTLRRGWREVVLECSARCFLLTRRSPFVCDIKRWRKQNNVINSDLFESLQLIDLYKKTFKDLFCQLNVFPLKLSKIDFFPFLPPLDWMLADGAPVVQSIKSWDEKQGKKVYRDEQIFRFFEKLLQTFALLSSLPVLDSDWGKQPYSCLQVHDFWKSYFKKTTVFKLITAH